MSWTAAIPLISKVFSFVVKAWKRYKRKRDYAKRQKKARKIARDPARAMSKHFPGDNDKLRDASGDDADGTDAAEAGKADHNGSRD